MGINPLQLPTWSPAPQTNFAPLGEIGQAIAAQRERDKLDAKEKAGNEAFTGLVDSVTKRPATAQAGAPTLPSGGMPRGLRNNNPGNLKDTAMSRALPGYKGADEGYAVFETPEHGLGAMDALLTSYGRRGHKTARDVVGAWAPQNDGNDVEAYAKYVGNGNPDAEIDLSNPQTRKEIAQRIGRYENGMAPPVSSAAGPSGSTHGMTPEMADKVKALFKSGDSKAREYGMALLTKYSGKQEPIHLKEGEQILHPETYQVLANAPDKPQSVRPGGALVQNGKVVYQSPSSEDNKPTIVSPGATAIDRNGKPIYQSPDRPQNVAPGGTLVQNGQPVYTAPERTRLPPGFETTPDGLRPIIGGPADPKYIANTKGEKNLTELAAEREKQVVSSGHDPNDERFRAYILTGKLPGEDKMPITPTDKKAILEADEHVNSHNQVIGNLKDLKDMSKKAWGFPGSGPAARVLSPVNQGAQDTQELNTTATANALAQLKSIFGAAPTEGERKILLDIQGSSAMPDALRQKIYDRAIKAAGTRLELAQKQADSIRDRTYWKPGGGNSTPPAKTLSKEQTKAAPTNPEAALTEARGAIAAGADRAQVIQRLQQLGIDPRGL